MSKGYTVPMHRRVKVLERDGWKCTYCHCPLTFDLVPTMWGDGGWQTPEGFERATVDHVIPRSQGGHHRESNLAACCGTCNSKKGTKPAEVMKQVRA